MVYYNRSKGRFILVLISLSIFQLTDVLILPFYPEKKKKPGTITNKLTMVVRPGTESLWAWYYVLQGFFIGFLVVSLYKFFKREFAV